jgi:TRAP-type C4-dicarboxylate transport system substrate-binding protein
MAMRLRWNKHARLLITTVLTLHAAQPWAQASGTAVQTLRVVGGLSGLNQYTHNEERFWSQELARLSGGKYAAEIVPFDRAGVPGPDMLRLLQFGVLPFGTALLSNISAQNPELAAPDLAGLNPDLPSLRKNLAAYRPYLEKTLREQHGIELLAVYTYPAQVLFCKNPLRKLADLGGRRVRVSSATQSDFVTALGATPVLIRLAQTISNMDSGNTECAITGAMSGNTIELDLRTHYLHAMPITWGLGLFGANQAAWAALPDDLRKLLTREIPKLEAAIWADSERETAEGIACNQGLPACKSGHMASMAVVSASADDERQRQAVLRSSILPSWLKRCGASCVEIWNRTLAASSGIRAASP